MNTSKRYDVLVVGGGVAGVAAALEAARGGLSTALIEKTIQWGGLATSGLVPIYMPLCDGQGRQVTFGIAEELLKCSIQYGPGRVPRRWAGDAGNEDASDGDATPPDVAALYPEAGSGARYQTIFSPAAFVFGLDEVLETCKADVWLDTLACRPVMKGQRMIGVEVENKSGRLALEAGCVVDATGDADLAARAGAPCRECGSYPSMLYQYTSLERARQAVEAGSARRLATWRGGGGANEFGRGYEGTGPVRSGVDGKDVSAFVMESRRIARRKLAEEQAERGPDGRENIYPTALPNMAQIRMTRAIEGQETVREDARNRRCASSVGLIADNRKAGAVWEVPYGALLPRGVENLLVVGRCASAEGYAWQVTRLIGPAALTGEVAGVAARLAAEAGTSPDHLEAGDVQHALEAKGFPLHV